jgi:hypothetical protein
MSPKLKKLKAAIEAAGYTEVKVWWEPMGIALEMCGHSGGYIFESEEEAEIPLGLSFAEALENLKLWNRNEPTGSTVLPGETFP